MADMEDATPSGGQFTIMIAYGRSARSILMTGACAALAACGSNARPGGNGPVPAVTTPTAAVSIPIPAAAPPPRRVAPARLTAAIDSLARNFDGKFGIAIRAVDDGWTVTSPGARTRMPQQSVSKLWVAMTLMDLRDQGKARLDDPVVVRDQDLTLFHQPIAMLVKGDGYHTTVGELLTRALTHSDNTANDRLLTYVVRTQAVSAII